MSEWLIGARTVAGLWSGPQGDPRLATPAPGAERVVERVFAEQVFATRKIAD